MLRRQQLISLGPLKLLCMSVKVCQGGPPTPPPTRVEVLRPSCCFFYTPPPNQMWSLQNLPPLKNVYPPRLNGCFTKICTPLSHLQSTETQTNPRDSSGSHVSGSYASGSHVSCERRASGSHVSCERHASGSHVSCERHASGSHVSYERHASGSHVSCERHASGSHVSCERHASGSHVSCERHASGSHSNFFKGRGISLECHRNFSKRCASHMCPHCHRWLLCIISASPRPLMFVLHHSSGVLRAGYGWSTSYMCPGGH